MEQLELKVFSFMEEHHMLSPGEKVVAGVSGGADSVCLLFVLAAWREKFGLEAAVAHINHGIRPEAGEDARFVEELCGHMGFPFYLREADVRGYALREKCSYEEAGRLLRYKAFEEVAAEFGADRVAVAHNLNDRAETMLFNLFRGSGLKGLSGILPVRGRIIRPLLCLERREIEEYLAGKGQSFCRDATNGEDHYTRNRIRRHILPYAEEAVSEGCVRHMGGTAELLAQTEDYMRAQTEEAIKSCAENRPEGYALDVEAFLSCHPALQKRMLHTLINNLSPGAKDIFRVHVEDMQRLFTAVGNRKICLPFGITGRREYNRVFLERAGGEGVKPLLQGISVSYTTLLAEDLPRDAQKAVIFPQNECTKWFDYDKIKEPLILRTRAPGDYLTIADGQGGMHHKSLKAYLVAEKIPENCRDGIPLLAEGAHILWVVGRRISEYYKITGNTKRVLQVKLITECKTEDKNGGTC